MNWLPGTLSYRISEAMICNFLSSKGRLTLTPPRRCDSRNAIAISNACRPSSPVHFGGRPVSMALTISSTIVNPMPCILTGHGNGHLAGTPPPPTTTRYGTDQFELFSIVKGSNSSRCSITSTSHDEAPQDVLRRYPRTPLLNAKYPFPIKSSPLAAASSDASSPTTHSTSHLVQYLPEF